MRALIEVNLAGEESKTGIAKGEVAGLLEKVSGLAHVSVQGLMTVPPFRENLEEVRPYFRELRELRDSLNSLNLPNVRLNELSMGMTHDLYRGDRRRRDDRAHRHGAIRAAEIITPMFLVANLLVAIAQILDYVLWAYAWILLARVVISYINADPQ